MVFEKENESKLTISDVVELWQRLQNAEKGLTKEHVYDAMAQLSPEAQIIAQADLEDTASSYHRFGVSDYTDKDRKRRIKL